MKSRTLIELILAATLATGGYYLAFFIPKHAKAGDPVLALANYFLTYSPIQRVNQQAYVVPPTLDLWDTPAEIRDQVATLWSGEEVFVLGRFRDWAHVRLLNDHEGWVSEDGLMDYKNHQSEESLLDALGEMTAQADGHPVGIENLHLQPARSAPVVTQVNPDQTLEIFDRKLVERPPENDPSGVLPDSANVREVWYLVRVGPHAGWILGHRVQLAIPKDIAAYAQNSNLVAWLVLNTVSDQGHRVPQYIVADRDGEENCDFTKIQVLTWWKRKQMYVVAFRQSGLQGYFPILVTREGSVPCFRLSIVDAQGHKGQESFGLFDTLTRPLGNSLDWASRAEPEQFSARFLKGGASARSPSGE